MRILLATDSYPPRPDGIATSTQALGHGLQQMGQELLVLCLEESASRPADSLRLPTSSFRAAHTWLADYPIMLPAPGQISRAIRSFSPDIINVHTLAPLGLTTAAYARRHRIPAVLTWHVDILAYRNSYNFLNFLIPIFYALWDFNSHPITALREAAAAELKTLVGLDSTKLHVDMLSSVISSFQHIVAPSIASANRMPKTSSVPVTVIPSTPIRTRQPLSTPEEEQLRSLKELLGEATRIIGYIGRISPEKNYRALLDCMRTVVLPQHPDSLLLLVGSARNESSLVREINDSSLRGRVKVTGPLPHTLIPYILDECTVLAFPSKTETQGLVLTEAALCGVPSIIADSTLNGIVVHEKTGLVAHDALSFGRSIVRLLSDPQLRNRLGNGAKDQALRYGEEEFSEAMLKVFEDTIETSKR